MRTVSDPEGVSRNKVPPLTLPPPRVRPKKSPLGACIRLVGALPSAQLGCEQNAYKVEKAPPGVNLKTVPGPVSPPVIPYKVPSWPCRRLAGYWPSGPEKAYSVEKWPGASMWKTERKSTRLNSSHLVISYA